MMGGLRTAPAGGLNHRTATFVSPAPPACSGGRVFATVSGAMSRVARTAAPAAEPKYPVWKANAVKALRSAHQRAAVVTPERLWRQLYIRRLDPDEAAKLARVNTTARTRRAGLRGGGEG